MDMEPWSQLNTTYYEASFFNDQLSGSGLLMLTDGTIYEGELGPGGLLTGKGELKLPTGDTLEGIFNGHPGIQSKVQWDLQEGHRRSRLSFYRVN